MKTKTEVIINPDTGELVITHPGSDNSTMLRERQAALDAIRKPKVGDFIRTWDGRLLRFTIDWDDSLQASHGGSFYLGPNGCDFSGSCGNSIRTYRMRRSGVRKSGSVWFFTNDRMGAGNGHETKAVFECWDEIPDCLLTTKQWKQRSRSATGRMVRAFKFWGYENITSGANYINFA